MRIRPRHLAVAAALLGAAALADSLLSEPEVPVFSPWQTPWATPWGAPQAAWQPARPPADGFWSTRFSAGHHDSASGAGYVSVPGYGPVGYGM